MAYTTHCPDHNQAWKRVPAGVSKTTGEPYDSFVCCPVRGCRQKPQKVQDAPAGRQSQSPPRQGNGTAHTSTVRSDRLLAAQAAIQAAATFYCGRDVPEENVLELGARIYHKFLSPAAIGHVPSSFREPIPTTDDYSPPADDSDIPF